MIEFNQCLFNLVYPTQNIFFGALKTLRKCLKD